MKLKEKFLAFDLDKMAADLGTKKIYLQQIYGGHATPSEKMARAIVIYSKGKIAFVDLLPQEAGEIKSIQDLESQNA